MNLTTSISETYELLVSLLAKCPCTIEILPGDATSFQLHPDNIEWDSSSLPFLFIEKNLAIPEKVLPEVYLHAVDVFKTARRCLPTRPTVMTSWNEDLDASLVRALTDSSSILLLANPSHQTALNARKHLVRMHLINPDAELCFIASLLSSRHCAKCAELWYHRRWLICGIYDIQLSDTMGADPYCGLRFASRESFQQELGVASRACEVYPRNYFAWTHRLICIRSLLLRYLSGADDMEFISLLRDEVVELKQWIERHISDYSAIHTILALSRAATLSRNSLLVEIIIEADLPGHAISLVQGYPTHEALWMYTRTSLSMSDSWQVQRTERFISDFVQPLKRLQHLKIGSKEDLIRASQYANRFLDRKFGDNFS